MAICTRSPKMPFVKQMVKADAKSVSRENLTLFDERVTINVELPDGRRWEILVDCLKGEPRHELVNSIYKPKEFYGDN